jgi:hypothetical protein
LKARAHTFEYLEALHKKRIDIPENYCYILDSSESISQSIDGASILSGHGRKVWLQINLTTMDKNRNLIDKECSNAFDLLIEIAFKGHSTIILQENDSSPSHFIDFLQ